MFENKELSTIAKQFVAHFESIPPFSVDDNLEKQTVVAIGRWPSYRSNNDRSLFLKEGELIHDCWSNRFLDDEEIAALERTMSSRFGPDLVIVSMRILDKRKVVYLHIGVTTPNGVLPKITKESSAGISLSDFEPEDADPDMLTGESARIMAPKFSFDEE